MTREEALEVVNRTARWSIEDTHLVGDESIEMIDPETGYHYWYSPETGELQGTTAPWQLFVG